MPSINSGLYYPFLYNLYIYFKNLNHIFVLNITKNEKQKFFFIFIDNSLLRMLFLWFLEKFCL